MEHLKESYVIMELSMPVVSLINFQNEQCQKTATLMYHPPSDDISERLNQTSRKL